MSRDAVLERFLATAVPRLRDRFGPVRIVLFGSRVRGDAHDASDLDVLLVAESFRAIPFVARMTEALNAAGFDRHVDFLCYTPEEFERLRPASALLRDALAEGLAA